MPAVLLGVRHHSPACARLVARRIEELRPAYVLVEGPADMNGRLAELFLGHELPVAVFSHYRDAERTATSLAPLCDYSPEWVALREGRAAGAEVRFIDLPAWHPAFTERADAAGPGADNRYADAEARYAEAVRRLCERFAVDSVDALWDRLFEVPDDEDLGERLDAYFSLLRGDAEADDGDRAREEYMASWVRAAVRKAGGRPVLVVTGGFHTPALRALTAPQARPGAAGGVARPEPPHTSEPSGTPAPGDGSASRPVPGPAGWPAVPAPPPGALGGSFLVPYSFRQLDAFAGYRSGMPSPAYYQELWEHGPAAAAQGLLRAVCERLRARRLPVSTADLIAARGLARGLAALRGHRVEARVDVLDGLVGALVGDDLEQPLPWTRRGSLGPGTHPAVVEMVAACTGDRVGRLHPGTPVPPLVHDVDAQLARLGLDPAADDVRLDLTSPRDLARSQVLHRLRVLGVPGFTRVSGPGRGLEPVFTERWEPGPRAGREAALIEAGAYGARLDEAAAVRLGERLRAAGSAGRAADAEPPAGLLFDAVLCGADAVSGELLGVLAERVGAMRELAALGEVLASSLGLWRHDRVYGVARSPLLAVVVDGAVGRVFRLVEGMHGGSGVDVGRLRALTAARDALLHAEGVLSLSRAAAVAAAERIGRDGHAPPDLRGAAFGLRWSLGPVPSVESPARRTGEGLRRRPTTRPGAWDLPGPARAEGTPDPAAQARNSEQALGAPADAGTAVRALAAASPDTLGDWLAGLFALAREEVVRGGAHRDGSLVEVLDGVLCAMDDTDFLGALPALRQAFAFFPPRERERIAGLLLERRGLRGSARALLRTGADPLLLARARTLEDTVTRLLDHHGLGAAR